MPQTSVFANPAVGQEGQLASSAGFKIGSRDANGAVPVGFCVVVESDTECRVPAVTAEVSDGTVLGISMLEPTRETANYADGESVSIVTAGDVWVNTATAATAGGAVYVVHATGAIRGTADASATVLPNAWLIFSLAIFTGLRQGEIFGLHWRDVHLDDPQPYPVVRYSWQKPCSKNGDVDRLTLTPLAVHILQMIPRDHELVFCRPDGKPHYGGRTDKKAGGGYDANWGKIRKKLGLNPEVTLHGLRHTCATALLSGVFGPPMRLEEVKDIMRHKDISQTQVYAKLLKINLYESLSKQTGPFRDLQPNKSEESTNNVLYLAS